MSTSNSYGDENAPHFQLSDSRVEPIPKPNFPHHEYPRWIGHKFSPSGDVLQYPGIAILAHLSPDDPSRQTLQDLLQALKAHELSSAFTFLPESSWHMTLYEGVTDEIRLRHSYPGDLPLDSSLESCNAHIARELTGFNPGLGVGGVGQMTVVGIEPVEDGLGLTLQTTSTEQETALRSLRNRLSSILKMRHPGHDKYSWHMALGYTLRHLTQGELATMQEFLQTWLAAHAMTFQLKVPELCTYDNMCHFTTILFLADRAD